MKLVNRELSWLEFNQRVLEEALDETNPLLERLKFLAITASNLDEFFRVRVGGLLLLDHEGGRRADPAGMTPRQQLDAIAERAHEMVDAVERVYLDEIEPGLAEEGLRRVRMDELQEPQAERAEQVFEAEVFPVLSPVAVTTEADAFPLTGHSQQSVAVRLGPSEAGDEPRFAVVPLGPGPSRFVTLPSTGGTDFVLLEDVVAKYAHRFFEEEEILECVPFRVTRNADYAVREDQAGDLMLQMEEVLDARLEAGCVRLEIGSAASDELRGYLQEVLGVEDDRVYPTAAPLALSDFFTVVEASGFDHLRVERWSPQPSTAIDPAESIFETIARRDVLLYHPYESFAPVVRFVEEAADDPDVLAIKQTLYRTSRDSPVVAALARAAEKGKHVTALVELKARFDEARNIAWARDLEKAGVQVVYGVKGLKTHAKICLVVRREPHGIQRYVHFGTGNYNESTARLYTDASLMTAAEAFGSDASRFFNAVCGYSQPMDFAEIEMAPLTLRDRILELVDAETQRARHGQPARIIAKLNSLVDPRIVEALYVASQAGVKVKLNVRGICCLRPGVEGLSENVEVVSIVDRLLEHTRVVCFHHGGDDLVFISSADWMPRNLDRRVELLVPVLDPRCKRRLIDVVETNLRDNVKARRILPDGRHERVKPKPGKPAFRSQQVLYDAQLEQVRAAELAKPTMFEPHRAPDAD